MSERTLRNHPPTSSEEGVTPPEDRSRKVTTVAVGQATTAVSARGVSAFNKAVGETEIIRALLRFANQLPGTYTVDVERAWPALLHEMYGGSWRSRDPEGGPYAADAGQARGTTEDQGLQECATEYDGQQHYDGLRSDVRRALQRAMKKPEGPGRRDEQWLRQKIEEFVVAKPTFRRGRIEYEYLVDSVDAGAALGLALLYERDQARHMRVCDECGSFFALTDGRAQARKYCSEKCRSRASTAASAERVRRYRERKRRQR